MTPSTLSAAPVSPAEIQRLFALQRGRRAALKAGTAVDRLQRLSRLREAIVAHADEIDEALHLDLRKERQGLKHFEIQSVLQEIDTAVAELGTWMAPEEVTPSPHFAGNRTYVMYEPRGVVLLFGPWNFAFNLVFAPLVQIISAGNACIVKPNEMQPRVSAITARLIREVFDEAEVAVVEGGVSLAEQLLELPFDHIFFTGSPAVGKRIMAAAARHLASVTLELGGKCPAVVDQGVDWIRTAGMVAAARFRNAGQLCLAVDHAWVPAAQRDTFVQILGGVVSKMFYADGRLQRDRIARIVDRRNFDRIKSAVDEAVAAGARVVVGGDFDADDLTISPTVLVDVPTGARIMQDEIFGPVLPVMGYQSTQEITAHVDATGKPLAMYIFSPDQAFVDEMLLNSSSGGVTVNGVMLHYAESRLPFGGCNTSGMGRYKGVHGFRELSNARSVFVAKA